jgi:ADP-ribose pyrophosphatase
MRYKLLNKQPLYRGFFELDAYEIEHECFAGGSQNIRREHLERGDAIAILLYDPQCDEVLLIEQFRIGPAVRDDESWLIEVVAGMVDEGEKPETAACRESVEEAGYEPSRVEYLGRYYSTPGGSSERIDLYLGLVDKSAPAGDGGGMKHEHEDIRPFWIGREEAMQWLTSGKINSGAPMLALLLSFGSAGKVAEL